jgi:hypothetical protein
MNGELHRMDEPAMEYANGDKRWFINSKLHRVDGPAVEYDSGSKEWWIDDKKYFKKDFNKIIKEAKALPLELRLIDPRWWVREMK